MTGATTDHPPFSGHMQMKQAADLVALETETPEHNSFAGLWTPENRKALLEGKFNPKEEIPLLRQVASSSIESIQVDAGTQLDSFLQVRQACVLYRPALVLTFTTKV